MKNAFGITLAGTTLMMAATAAHAGLADNLYLDLHAGVAVAQKTDIQGDAFGTGSGGHIKFDTGYRAGINLGYKITPYLAVELESGIIHNDINFLGFNSLSPIAASADLYQIPLLVNVVFEPWHGAFKPYIGVGAGGVAGIFNGSNIPLIFNNYSDTDFVFAYQATIGFKYALTHRIDVGAAYQFLSANGNTWTDHGVPFKTDGVLTHSFTASFTWRF